MGKSIVGFIVVFVLLLAGCGGGGVDVAASGTLSGKIAESQLGPGKLARATFDLPAGSYVLICDIPSHYKDGMHAPLQVTTADGSTSAAVAVELGEWFVRPSSGSVGAGSITFEVRNLGDSEHNFVVIQTDLAPEALLMK